MTLLHGLRGVQYYLPMANVSITPCKLSLSIAETANIHSLTNQIAMGTEMAVYQTGHKSNSLRPLHSVLDI